MNLKTLKQTTSVAAILFALLCILWVTLALVLLPSAAGQEDYSLLVADPQWKLVALTGLLASLFGVFAVMGIYLANHEKGGILLFIGMILLVLGILFEFGSLTWELFIWPVVCAHEAYVSFVRDAVLLSSPLFTVYIVCMLAFLVTGNLLIAIAFFKNRIYGWLIPSLLLAGILLYGLANVFSNTLGMIGLSLYGLSFLLIGIRLLKE